MERVMRIKTFLATSLLACRATAEVPPQPPLLPELPRLELRAVPSGDDQIRALTRGAPAPYDGQLFDHMTSLRWANWLEQCRSQQDSTRLTGTRFLAAERQYWLSVEGARSTAATTTIQDLTGRVHALDLQSQRLAEELRQGPPWYGSVWFGVVVGFVGSVTFTALAVWALQSVK